MYDLIGVHVTSNNEIQQELYYHSGNTDSFMCF
jgi:hypothetical protein